MPKLSLLEIAENSQVVYTAQVLPAFRQLSEFMQEPDNCKQAFETTPHDVTDLFFYTVRRDRAAELETCLPIYLSDIVILRSVDARTFLESLATDLTHKYEVFKNNRTLGVTPPIIDPVYMRNTVRESINTSGLSYPPSVPPKGTPLGYKGRVPRQQMGRRKTDS